jgi:hypothetical protein
MVVRIIAFLPKVSRSHNRDRGEISLRERKGKYISECEVPVLPAIFGGQKKHLSSPGSFYGEGRV